MTDKKVMKEKLVKAAKNDPFIAAYLSIIKREADLKKQNKDSKPSDE